MPFAAGRSPVPIAPGRPRVPIATGHTRVPNARALPVAAAKRGESIAAGLSCVANAKRERRLPQRGPALGVVQAQSRPRPFA